MTEKKLSTIAVLSTDTLHHRYFLNTLRAQGIPIGPVIFETSSVKPPFVTGPFYEEEQEAFEREHWDGKLDLNGFEISEVSNINDPDSHQIIKFAQPNFGLVFGTRRLTQGSIELFADGLVNVHRGISQEYRGLESDLWAIYHRDFKNIGVTLHKIDKDLDTGGIVAQGRLPLLSRMKIQHLRLYTSEMATRMMVDVVKNYISGTLIEAPQTVKGRYYSFMPIDLKHVVKDYFEKYCNGLSK